MVPLFYTERAKTESKLMTIDADRIYRCRKYFCIQLNNKRSDEMCINDVRPVRYVIDAIRATDAMLCRDTSTGNNTCRRPPLAYLPGRCPRAACGTVWHTVHGNK